MTKWKVAKPSFISPMQLRSAREQIKMSRADLARACRVSIYTVSDWENSSEPIHIPPFSPFRILHRIIALAPHLAARRANPNWNL